MSPSVSFTALRERFQQDLGSEATGGHDLVASRLEQALDAIGWRSAGGSSSEDVAAIAAHVLADCVNSHRDVHRASQAIADLLYNSAASLDGSMYSASAFLPAAEEVLSRYAMARK
jgi:hypothetical protein